MAVYMYECSKCHSPVTEVDKIPVEWLPQYQCPFCRAKGTLEYKGKRD